MAVTTDHHLLFGMVIYHPANQRKVANQYVVGPLRVMVSSQKFGWQKWLHKFV